MSSHKHIQDELRSLASGLPVNNNLPYSVPDGYFDGLAARVLAKVKSDDTIRAELEEISPLLAGIPKRMPFSVPSSYFEENMAAIGAISGEGSPYLDTIGKRMPYTVPLDYFETLPDQMLKTVQPKTKVVPLFGRTWMRVASAAAVIGALFFGGYQLLSSGNKVDTALADPMVADTMQQQVASNTPPVRKDIKQMSTKELEDFIATVQTGAAKSAGEKLNKGNNKELEVEELLKDVSTSEMERFLSAIPTVDDDLMITD